MLNNQSLNDPWLSPSPPLKYEPAPQTWQLKEPFLLLAAAENTNLPQLTAHQLTSIEILLLEELKLKALRSPIFKPQLDKALTLIYWFETINN